MQAMPDKVVEESTASSIEGPGRYGKDVDLDARPIKTLVSTMAAKGIYSDPTMVAFEGLVPENGSCRHRIRHSSARCHPRPNAVSGSVDSRCPRT